MFPGEVEATVVERRTAQETALADGIARILLFVQVLKQDGQEKTATEVSRLFPFAMGGWDLSDPAAILRTLEKLDPLGKVDRANVTERIFARNLIALALLEVAQKDAGGAADSAQVQEGRGADSRGRIHHRFILRSRGCGLR